MSMPHRQLTAVHTPLVNIYPLTHSHGHLHTLKYLSSSYIPCEQRLQFRCVSCPAKSSLSRLATVQIRPEIWTNKLKKAVFFLFLIGFRPFREPCVADQSCRNFFLSAKLAAFDDRPDYKILLANSVTNFAHAR